MSEDFMPLVALADLLGRYRYVELALGEAALCAGRAAAHAACTIALSDAAQSHGWRAALVERAMPVSVGLPAPGECTRSPGAEHAAALGAVAGLPCDEAVAALVAWHDAMASAYAAHLGSCVPVRDAAVAVVLERLVADLVRSSARLRRVLSGRAPHGAEPPVTGAFGAATAGA